MGGGKNFRKPSAVGMGGRKTLISRRRVTFLGKGSKDLPGKWKLHNLNYILITLTLCKIYAYSENISSLSLWICKFTIYTHVLNEFSEKKTCWAGRFYSSSIFVRLYVFCNLTQIAYFLCVLHYPPYAHAIFYTHTLSRLLTNSRRQLANSKKFQ